MTQRGGHAHRPESAAAVLYRGWVAEHAAGLYRLAYRLCGDRNDAEDLVQETFYEAWKSMSRLRQNDRARAWLYQILRHRYAHLRRSEARSPAPVRLDSIDPESISSRSDASSGFDSATLQHALNQLSDRVKIPLLVITMEGLTCQEAADRLDLPLGTVLSRIHRARQRLRQLLRAEDTDVERGERHRSQPRYRFGDQP